jgi:transposase InsO family protein
VQRQTYAERPTQLWVGNLTYVVTRRGLVYVAFVIEVCSLRVVVRRTHTTGSVEDPNHNALTETVIGLFKSEVLTGRTVVWLCEC